MARKNPTKNMTSVATLVELIKEDGTPVPMTITHGSELVNGESRDCIRWTVNGSGENGPMSTVKVNARTAASIAYVRLTDVTEDENGKKVKAERGYTVRRRDETWNQSGPSSADVRTAATFIGDSTGLPRTLTIVPTLVPHKEDREDGAWIFSLRLNLVKLDAAASAVMDF
jgi:hypothetical protein